MADILIAPGSTMPSAPTGEVTLFLNTENGNVLSYINDAGVIFVYNSGDTSVLEECCSCEIAKKWISSVTCALESGMLTANQFGTITNQGLIVTSTEVIDAGTGAKTCTVEIGPKSVNPIAVTQITVSGDFLMGIGLSVQLAAAILPINATNQAVLWISSNPSIATVNASGLVTGIATGSATIYAYSQSNPTVFATLTVTVS